MLFGLLFGTALVLIRTALPEGAEEGAQWLDSGSTRMRVAAILMPFAGIAFLWFIGVVRDVFGLLEGQVLLKGVHRRGADVLAMTLGSSAIGAGLAASSRDVVDAVAHAEVATFGQMVLITLTKTYALRMGAVFMISLATIWIKTELMPRWLVIVTYVLALGILFASDISMWMTLAFPVWVLIVSLFLLAKAGVIDLDGDR